MNPLINLKLLAISLIMISCFACCFKEQQALLFDGFLSKKSNIYMVEIINSDEVVELVTGKKFSCGINYDAKVLDSLKGEFREVIEFSSEENLKKHKKYLLILAPKMKPILNENVVVIDPDTNMEVNLDECNGRLESRFVDFFSVFPVEAIEKSNRVSNWVKVELGNVKDLVIPNGIEYFYQENESELLFIEYESLKKWVGDNK